MDTVDRRTDSTTSQLIEEALRFKRTFDWDAALKFLETRGLDVGLADQVLSGTYKQ